MKVKEICDYSGSTLLGRNGGMVESPDSKRIIYARKADLTKSETEIWICDRDFENHRKVYDVHCGNHNGPSATFMAKSRLYVYSVYSMLIRVRLSTKFAAKKVIVRKTASIRFQYRQNILTKIPIIPKLIRAEFTYLMLKAEK